MRKMHSQTILKFQMSCSLTFMLIFKNLSQVLKSLYLKHSNNSVRNVAFALTEVTPNHTYVIHVRFTDVFVLDSKFEILILESRKRSISHNR